MCTKILFDYWPVEVNYVWWNKITLYRLSLFKRYVSSDFCTALYTCIMPVKATKETTTKLSFIWHYLSAGSGYSQYLEIPKR